MSVPLFAALFGSMASPQQQPKAGSPSSSSRTAPDGGLAPQRQPDPSSPLEVMAPKTRAEFDRAVQELSLIHI